MLDDRRTRQKNLGVRSVKTSPSGPWSWVLPETQQERKIVYLNAVRKARARRNLNAPRIKKQRQDTATNDGAEEYRHLLRKLLDSTTSLLEMTRDAVNKAEYYRTELLDLAESKASKAEEDVL